MAELSKQLVDAMKQSAESKTSAFDSIGTVRRVKDGIAYVHLAGGVDETPVQLTVDAKTGDEVQVRVSGGRAWIVGNATAPPTDNTMAKQAINYSKIANDAAQRATKDALVANEAAQSASASAREAKETTDEINAYAETAGKTVTQILNDGETAGTAAQQALKGLGQVEDVVGTLNWITDHSKVTTDTTPQAGKSYYIKNQDNTFTLVTDVEGKNPAQEGWYELTEAVQNYILSHLALTNEGLYVMKDDSHWRLLIKNDGVYVVDENNVPVNQMGIVGNVVGYETNMHLKMDYDSIDFMDGEDRLGYIGNNKLLFASAEVTNNLYVTDRYVWRKTPQGAMGLYLR